MEIGVVLTRNNYERWSILMRHYLMGQDLWNIVESRQLPTERNMRDQWIKKNASVLHVIKLSCGEEIFDQIKAMDSAKDVWDALANMHKPPAVSQETAELHETVELPEIAVPQEIAEQPLERPTETFTAQTFGDLGRSQYETLTNAISNGELTKVEEIFAQNPGEESARIFENGYTALHFSVYNRKERIVDFLIDFKLSKEELEIRDDFGSTALCIAARFGVRKSIAQKLVGKNRNLLTIPDNDGKIPVQLACSTIHEDMARYLYVATPLECLNGDRGFDILQQCIIRKMFDIASDLLHRFPKLASTSCPPGSTPLILTLAKTPPPFFGGSYLSFWERCTYGCIIVKACSIKKDEHRPCVQKIQAFYQSCKMKITDLFGQCMFFVYKSVCGPVFAMQIAPLCCNVNRRGLLKAFVWFVVKATRIFLVMPAVIMLSMPLILCFLIRGAIRILVSLLSRCFARDLYQLKLMDAYAREVVRLICHESFSKLDEIQFGQSNAVEATFQAIKNGIPYIVKEIVNANDDILRSIIDPEDLKNIFACAIAHRQEEVACILYEFAKEDRSIITIDKDGNNILHLTAKLAPPYQLGCISGSALQLQWELLWFMGVEKIVPQSYQERKNNDRETPLEVFVKEHKDLLKEAVEWGKKTAESSTVVGALIITIMFAVAFTVPGGNDQSTGFPILSHKTPIPFMIFMVSDALSLFAASSTVIIFLGILTAHQADEDYRKYSLVISGLTYLFISIATMTIAFCAALFIMLQGRLVIVIPITLVAGIPIKWFVQLQFPLLVDILCLTLRPNIFSRRERIMKKMLVRLWEFVGR